MYLPHAHVYLSEVRTNDIWFLLLIGFVWEFSCRCYLLFGGCKCKSHHEISTEKKMKLLQIDTNYQRSLGIQSFVITSKLERQLLQIEKEVTTLKEQRKNKLIKMEKLLQRYGNVYLTIMIWLFYYAVPVLIVVTTEKESYNLLQTMLFPISHVGFGIRFSRFGLPNDIANQSLGALLVYWSAQVTTGKIMDAVDAYYL